MSVIKSIKGLKRAYFIPSLLLASVELLAVGGRARLLTVGGGKAGAPRYRIKTARGALRPLGAAVSIPKVVLAREVIGIKRIYSIR